MSAHPNSDSHDIAWAGHAKDVPITGDGFETTTALAISAADAPRTPLPAVGTSMGDCAVHYGGVLGLKFFRRPLASRSLTKAPSSATAADGGQLPKRLRYVATSSAGTTTSQILRLTSESLPALGREFSSSRLTPRKDTAKAWTVLRRWRRLKPS
jgi:hypothetical protein